MHTYIAILFNTKQTIQRIESGELAYNKWISYLIVSIFASVPVIRKVELLIDESLLGLTVGLVAFVLTSGLIFSMLIYILTALYYGTSRLFGSKANFGEFQLILSFVFIPEIILAANKLIRYFLPSTNGLADADPIVYVIVQLFAFKILIIGLSHFNRITYQKAFMITIAAMIPVIIVYGLRVL